MKNGKKVMVTASLLMLLTGCFVLPAYAGMMDGLTSIKDGLMADVKTLLDDIIVPLCLGVAIVFLIINIVRLLKLRNAGESMAPMIAPLAITVAVALVLGSWYVWGPVMMA